MVNATPRPLYPRNDPVTIVWEAGWAPGPAWTDAENLAPPEFFVLCTSSVLSVFNVLHFAFCRYNTTQTSMPPARFEPTIPASERPHACALDDAVTGISARSPGRPAHSESLYRLSYPDPQFCALVGVYLNTGRPFITTAYCLRP